MTVVHSRAEALMKNGDKKSNDQKNNVIDLTERVTSPDYRERLRGLKVRFDLEHAKIAVSTSLLSIVILVTLANNNLMTSISAEGVQPQASGGARGIASVPSSSASADTAVSENPQLVKALASRDLGPNAKVGHKPSGLERLAFGYLEGKYAVRLHHGKLAEIEISDQTGQDAKAIDNTQAFLDSQRELLPDYERSIKVEAARENGENIETFQLVNQVSMPVAKVQFRLDGGGHLLSMRVLHMQVAAK